MMYATPLTTSSAASDDRWLRPSEAPGVWYLRPVDEPEIESGLIATGMTNRLLDEIEKAAATSPALHRATVYGTNCIARLARNRDGDRVQITASFIAKGADVSRATARHALKLLRDVLVAQGATIIFGGRTFRSYGHCGWLTLIPEAFAACIRVINEVGAPKPLVGAPPASGRQVEINIPSGKARGKTRCPCGAHARGDRRDTLAFDLQRGLCTCQLSRAVFRLGDDGAWTEVRAPWAHLAACSA